MYATFYNMPEVTHYGAQMLSNREILHREICNACGKVKRAERHILYDISRSADMNGLDLVIQSDVIPDDIPDFHKITSIDMSDVLDRIHEGDDFMFSIKTAPYKSLKGKKYYIPASEDRKNWVKRKFATYGIEVNTVRESNGAVPVDFEHKKSLGGKGHVDAMVYMGTGTIVNEEQMKESLKNGIGPGKAYGLGLLKILKIG